MRYRYTMLNNEITSTRTNVTIVACIFFVNGVGLYGLSSKLLTDNSTQLVSIFIMAICSTLEVDNITFTEYRSQSDSHATSQYTLVSRLPHNVSEI